MTNENPLPNDHPACSPHRSPPSPRTRGWSLKARAGPGKGKHVVLISGDEEYRTEEALPMLGKMLAEKHGFKCTVLFAIDPATGTIDPKEQTNIPGWAAQDSADFLVLGLRFRDLPDDGDEAHRRLRGGGQAAARHPDLHPRLQLLQQEGQPYASGPSIQRRLRQEGAGRNLDQPPWRPRQGEHARRDRGGQQEPSPRSPASAMSGARAMSTA